MGTYGMKLCDPMPGRQSQEEESCPPQSLPVSQHGCCVGRKERPHSQAACHQMPGSEAEGRGKAHRGKPAGGKKGTKDMTRTWKDEEHWGTEGGVGRSERRGSGMTGRERGGGRREARGSEGGKKSKRQSGTEGGARGYKRRGGGDCRENSSRKEMPEDRRKAKPGEERGTRKGFRGGGGRRGRGRVSGKDGGEGGGRGEKRRGGRGQGGAGGRGNAQIPVSWDRRSGDGEFLGKGPGQFRMQEPEGGNMLLTGRIGKEGRSWAKEGRGLC